MSIDQLQPKPRPGEFTSPVNVNELNRILRKVQQDNVELRARLDQALALLNVPPTTSVESSSLTPSGVDDTLEWVL